MRKMIFLLLIYVVSSHVVAQSLYSRVVSHRSNIVVGQPLKIDLHVYTSSSFVGEMKRSEVTSTNGYILPNVLDLGTNTIVINDEVVMERTFRYTVVPMVPGNFIFPSFEIKTMVAANRGFVPIDKTCKSKPIKVKVESLPQDDLYSSSQVILKQKWKNLQDTMYVGQVFFQDVTVYTVNTLASFITPFNFEEVDFVRGYLQKDTTIQRIGLDAIRSQRKEKMLYLLTKTGEYHLPKVSVRYYNPYLNREVTKSIDGPFVVVKRNSNSDVLLSQNSILGNKTLDSDTKFSLLDFVKENYIFILWGILVLLLILLLLKRLFSLRFHQVQENEEMIAFKCLLKTSKKDSMRLFTVRLYRWILAKKEVSINTSKLLKDSVIVDDVYEWFESHYCNGSKEDILTRPNLKREIKKMSNKTIVSSDKNWWNPRFKC
ncbi:BatD family protein [Halosquirtibacter laminarini]|uniref:BatD family protein n=1 Tax=Halosquirtibacter laminarini TaxID=3374600 RepID=A0AC61NQD0_9BACT|nr:BatD family protein [Prolixibacteraceae bacterium]